MKSFSSQWSVVSKSIFRLMLFAMLFALCASAQAQQEPKISTIGWLTNSTRLRFDDYKKALRAVGYIEGKNIAFEYRFAEGEPRRFPALAAELVRLKVDLIVANSTTSAKAAKDATRTIPIVFSSAGDPVAVGLIDSLARPGGNITGFSNITSELTGKRMEFLKETVPKLSRVAVLRDSQSAASTEEWKESLHPARELGLELHSMEVSSADKFESAFKEAVQARSAALLVTGSGVNNSNHKRIADLTLKHRLPAIARFGDFVASGGLMSYGNDAAENYKRAAYLIDKVLRGAKPADLPVERPTNFEFVINLKTAKQIGLTIPPSVLAKADRVIK